MTDEDLIWRRIVTDFLQALGRDWLTTAKASLRTANMPIDDIERLTLLISGALADPSTDLTTMTAIVRDMTKARIAGAKLR